MTKKENRKRIKILKEARQLILDRDQYFICKALDEIMAGQKRVSVGFKEVFEMFPELILYRPTGVKVTGMWWGKDNVRIRITIIDSMIKDIEANI